MSEGYLLDVFHGEPVLQLAGVEVHRAEVRLAHRPRQHHFVPLRARRRLDLADELVLARQQLFHQ